MNILFLYNASQTYTSTVFEHISSFAKYSKHDAFFAHQDHRDAPSARLNLDLSLFDVIVIHYTIRLPFDQLAEQNVPMLSAYTGLKVLFIQDEYDDPTRTWSWIRRLGIRLVFTVVPDAGVSRVYPPAELPGVRFVSVLTGYVPEELPNCSFCPPSQRKLVVGYRGRPLPIRYGDLGREKTEIGKIVAAYCDTHSIHHDIAWTEEARIYGDAWYEFVSSCRSMLGSESGSNVFDWEGTLWAEIRKFKTNNPLANDELMYANLIRPLEVPGLMNQVSPRIFEAIALRTVLVLFEGGYSGVVNPDEHFIALKKDGSNLDEVFRKLSDPCYTDEMVERVYRDVILSGRYSYRAFVGLVDREIESMTTSMGVTAICQNPRSDPINLLVSSAKLTRSPLRATPPRSSYITELWMKLPESVRKVLAPPLKWVLGKG